MSALINLVLKCERYKLSKQEDIILHCDFRNALRRFCYISPFSNSFLLHFLQNISSSCPSYQISTFDTSQFQQLLKIVMRCTSWQYLPPALSCCWESSLGQSQVRQDLSVFQQVISELKLNLMKMLFLLQILVSPQYNLSKLQQFSSSFRNSHKNHIEVSTAVLVLLKTYLHFNLFYVGKLSTDLSEYSSFRVLSYSSHSRNRCLVSK